MIAVGNETGSLFGVASIIAAAFAAGAAVASFWPRKFPSFDPRRLGDYAVSELAFTQLTVLDTLEVMLVETRSLLEVKSRRLKWALASLSVGALLGALELINK